MPASQAHPPPAKTGGFSCLSWQPRHLAFVPVVHGVQRIANPARSGTKLAQNSQCVRTHPQTTAIPRRKRACQCVRTHPIKTPHGILTIKRPVGVLISPLIQYWRCPVLFQFCPACRDGSRPAPGLGCPNLGAGPRLACAVNGASRLGDGFDVGVSPMSQAHRSTDRFVRLSRAGGERTRRGRQAHRTAWCNGVNTIPIYFCTDRAIRPSRSMASATLPAAV